MPNVNIILDSMHRAMRKNPIFGDLLSLQDREYLLKRGTIRVVGAGEVLCRQYQRDRNVFMLINGVVEVTEEIHNKQVSLGKLCSGEVFGEIAALFMMPRIATVTVIRDSVVLEIPGEVLEELIEQVPVLRDAVFERYHKRSIQTALKSVSIFNSLTDEAFDDMCKVASLVTAPKGECLIREGELGDALFIINYGVARVFTTDDDTELNLALLRPGDYFGEWSLLTGAPRAASIAAVTQMELVRLGCEEFLEFIRKFPDIRESIDLVAHERKSRTEHARTRPESENDVQTILNDIENILVAEHEV
ncbi:cyclic nucleotide-binding domain-containing protein [Sulfuriflexus mobilis]|uniref:cyclic nucleotide-binding domain-containing protein n=1 Tax=Sulfuriflexus mobilis TaxID=1811807 RepID=UPI000F820BDB|nr:cyclic nucleotide-binding domain-containing protein [Sulfuriflexus mobilis]